MRLRAHNLTLHLPDGWDGRIYARPAPDERAAGAGRPGASKMPVTLHAASFPLPRRDGDFGSGATAAMTAKDAFLAVTEYVEGGGLRAGSGLFRSHGPPRTLDLGMFSHRTLLVARPGQAGCQHFFTQGGRPFCLYAVLGSPAAARGSLQDLNDALPSLEIG